jgi:hypothetical protein
MCEDILAEDVSASSSVHSRLHAEALQLYFADTILRRLRCTSGAGAEIEQKCRSDHPVERVLPYE